MQYLYDYTYIKCISGSNESSISFLNVNFDTSLVFTFITVGLPQSWLLGSLVIDSSSQVSFLNPTQISN